MCIFRIMFRGRVSTGGDGSVRCWFKGRIMYLFRISFMGREVGGRVGQ